MAIDALRQTVASLNVSAGALAALGAALDARMSGVALAPGIRPYVEDIITALGAREAIAEATPAQVQPLLGEIRAFAMANTQLLFAATRHCGWTHAEPEILLAAGEVSVGIPRMLRQSIACHLPGLAQRLNSPCASFLDVGVGVAALSIEMAGLWPTLHIVGIDRWAPALALARERVQAAGLAQRIALREQSGEGLSDIDAFDLAWIPGAFVAEEATRTLIGRVHRALRPGGWLLLAMVCSDDNTIAGAVARLRTAMFGGFVTTNETIETLLRGQGFVDVRTLPRAPNSFAAVVAARRPDVDSRWSCVERHAMEQHE